MSRPAKRGVAAIGGSLVLSQVLIGVAGVIAARDLGPDGRGIVGGVLIWAQTIPLVALAGVNSALTVRVARGEANAVGIAVGNALVYSGLVGGLTVIPALIVVAPTLGGLGPDAERLAYLALATIPVGILTELLFAILIALNRIARFNLCRLIAPVGILGGTLVLSLVDRITPTTIVITTLAGSGLTLVACASGLPWRRLLVVPKELWRDTVFGVKTAIAGWASLVNLRLDVLLMSLFAAASQIGLYGVANNVMLPIATIPSAAAGLLMPEVARLARDVEGQVALIKKEVVRYGKIAIAGGLLLAACVPLAIPVLFGDSFEPAVVLVWILIPGFVARVPASLVTVGAVGMRRPSVGNIIELSSLVMTAALLPWLLPRYEATGAAITSAAAYGVAGLTALFALRFLARSEAKKIPPQGADMQVLPEAQLGSNTGTG